MGNDRENRMHSYRKSHTIKRNVRIEFPLGGTERGGVAGGGAVLWVKNRKVKFILIGFLTKGQSIVF